MKEYIEMPDCPVMLAKEILQLLEDDILCAVPDTQYYRDANEYARQLRVCIEEYEK